MIKVKLLTVITVLFCNLLLSSCLSADKMTDNITPTQTVSNSTQQYTVDKQRYLIRYDNGVFSKSHSYYDPRGQYVSFSPPVNPFTITKIHIRGYRTDFPNADNKTYTLKIWDGRFKKELFSKDYPYTNFSTAPTMVEHKLQPPLTVTDNFTVDFISHSEPKSNTDQNHKAIYITYDNTLSINTHSGVSWLGTDDLETAAIKEKKFIHACWLIQVEGYGPAINGNNQATITVTENIDKVVDGKYYSPFPCASIHPQINEARDLIKKAMARRSSLSASEFGTLIGEERDTMYKAIDILEQCAITITDSECNLIDKNITLSSIYNDIGFCHTFLKNENYASDYFYKALKVNPENKWAASNIQATKDLILPGKVVYYNLSQ